MASPLITSQAPLVLFNSSARPAVLLSCQGCTRPSIRLQRSHDRRRTVRAAEVMELTGWPFLAVLCACSIALITVTMMLWNRWPARWALVLRLGCLLLLMITGAAVSADVVNREFGFYASFDDLLDRLPPVAVTHCPGGSDGATPGLVRGRIERVRLAGSDSGISREALVYLPATYASPVGVHRRFPVIELFHGYPGGPATGNAVWA